MAKTKQRQTWTPEAMWEQTKNIIIFWAKYITINNKYCYFLKIWIDPIIIHSHEWLFLVKQQSSKVCQICILIKSKVGKLKNLSQNGLKTVLPLSRHLCQAVRVSVSEWSRNVFSVSCILNISYLWHKTITHPSMTIMHTAYS